MNNQIVVVAVSLAIGAAVAGGGVWYLQSNTTVDVAITTEPTTAAPAPSAVPQTIADIIPGYDAMTAGEKQKAISAARKQLGPDDREALLLLAKADSVLFSDGSKFKGVQFKGVLPDGWVE